MTARIVAGALVALALALAAGCSAGPATEPAPAEAPAPTAGSLLDEVRAKGEIRVCSTGDYRPFTYLDKATGTWEGIDIDMAGDLAAKLGVRLTLVETTWGTLLDDLGRTCDIAMGGISVTTDRAQRAFYSDPYLVDGKTPITRCENVDRFQTLEQIDQPGVRAVVNPGGTNESFVEANLERAEIVRHPDNNTIFEEILAGRADLMITDATETRWQQQQHPELCAVHPEAPFTFSEKAYLLPRGDVVLQEWVNTWLRIARNDGTYDRFARPRLG
ncbi:MAG TPA: transporter substrate-binding domain-containing protein [Pseudonocardia sp.]|uniref:transporter substrate-binding domain-containing protein n=1 Tax=Pseudonocardia sp. TaxID=60912 RepID=UPI002B4B01BE|nr:transporter substrate-binding domain-containing protein [Pseudonocardia sp.]HLU59201.1 transporter substrate-binding domain-containing protein [Pseudonocardia sp.]